MKKKKHETGLQVLRSEQLSFKTLCDIYFVKIALLAHKHILQQAFTKKFQRTPENTVLFFGVQDCCLKK